MSAQSSGESSRHDFVRPEIVKKHSDLIYDIGLNEGQDTDFYLRKGFRVVAIEADPDLCRDCRRRFEKYIDSGQLVLLEGAIHAGHASPVSTVRFYKHDGKSDWGTVVPDWASRNSRLGVSSVTIEVNTVDLTQVIRKFGMPHYMKIDIEGSDMVCVEALRQFQPRPDFISIESDKVRFSNIRREIDTLVHLGYGAFQAIEQSTIPTMQNPPNPSREGQFAARTLWEGSSGLFGFELDGRWLTRPQVLLRYRFIRLGYYLVGDEGVMNNWRFRGARRLRGIAARVIAWLIGSPFPGWYDTHARHSSVIGSSPS